MWFPFYFAFSFIPFDLLALLAIYFFAFCLHKFALLLDFVFFASLQNAFLFPFMAIYYYAFFLLRSAFCSGGFRFKNLLSLTKYF